MHRHGTGRWQCGGLTEGWGRVNSVSIIHESNLLIFIRGYQQKLPSYVGIFFSGSQVSGSQVFSLVFCFYKLRYHGIHHRIIWNSTFWNFFPPHLKQLGPWWSLSSPFRIGLDWTPKWPNSMGWSSKYQTWMSLSPFFITYGGAIISWRLQETMYTPGSNHIAGWNGWTLWQRVDVCPMYWPYCKKMGPFSSQLCYIVYQTLIEKKHADPDDLWPEKKQLSPHPPFAAASQRDFWSPHVMTQYAPWRWVGKYGLLENIFLANIWVSTFLVGIPGYLSFPIYTKKFSLQIKTHRKNSNWLITW